MAMNGARLGTAIAAAVQVIIDQINANPPGTPMTPAQLEASHAASGQQIIDEIVNNAEIFTPSGPGSII